MIKNRTITIIADDKIPLLAETFGQTNINLISKPGCLITKNDLIDGDLLLVRTVTPVNETLLKGTSIKFVGSATAGFDHIDRTWLNENGIRWSSAQGCNAQAVSEYVLSCIARLQINKQLTKSKLKVGLIGVGHTGNRVLYYLRKLGYNVLCHDPPKALQDKNFSSVPLTEFFDRDLICIHASLNEYPQFPSFHLVDHSFLEQLKPGCVILNVGRGAIVNNQALSSSTHIIPCLDVWENEPNINFDLLQKCIIATPHIGGYSFAAKQRATIMLYRQAQRLFELPEINEANLIPQKNKKIELSSESNWQEAVLSCFDPMAETQRMKTTLLTNPKNIQVLFENLRREYQLRPEFLSN